MLISWCQRWIIEKSNNPNKIPIFSFLTNQLEKNNCSYQYKNNRINLLLSRNGTIFAHQVPQCSVLLTWWTLECEAASVQTVGSIFYTALIALQKSEQFTVKMTSKTVILGYKRAVSPLCIIRQSESSTGIEQAASTNKHCITVGKIKTIKRRN